MHKLIIIITTMLILVGCTTMDKMASTSLTESEKKLFTSDKVGVFIFNAYSDLSCSTYNLDLLNLDNFQVRAIVSESHPVLKFDEDISDRSFPATIALSSGRYAIIGGQCESYGYTGGKLPLLKYWFEPFEIKAGEYHYLGTLHVKDMDVSSKSDTPKLLRKTDRHTYVIYNFEDQSERVIRHLKASYPDIESRLKVKIPKQVIDEEKYTEIIIEAYKADTNGNLPTSKEAKEKSKNALSDYFDKSGVYAKTIEPISKNFKNSMKIKPDIE